jgi:integrase
MVVRGRHGKGGRDRDVLLSEKLLDTLREYWRWMKPKSYLFPGTVNNWRADVPITTKIVWNAVNEARIKAGIQKRVSPHTLRHSFATQQATAFGISTDRTLLGRIARCSMPLRAAAPRCSAGTGISRELRASGHSV